MTLWIWYYFWRLHSKCLFCKIWHQGAYLPAWRSWFSELSIFCFHLTPLTILSLSFTFYSMLVSFEFLSPHSQYFLLRIPSMTEAFCISLLYHHNKLSPTTWLILSKVYYFIFVVSRNSKVKLFMYVIPLEIFRRVCLMLPSQIVWLQHFLEFLTCK